MTSQFPILCMVKDLCYYACNTCNTYTAMLPVVCVVMGLGVAIDSTFSVQRKYYCIYGVAYREWECFDGERFRKSVLGQSKNFPITVWVQQDFK